MAECSEELSEEVVCTVWEGSWRAQQGDVAWMEAIILSSNSQHHVESLQAISHDILVSEQRKDPAIGKVMELKENDTPLTG